MEPQIEITEFTGPYSTWCWGSEPVLRHALEAYGDQISLRFVMGGLVEDRLSFVDKYGNAAPREVAEVFEVADDAADEALQRLTTAGLLECVQVETGRFYRAVKGEGFCVAATGVCG